MFWKPDSRDKAWMKFYENNKGKIDADAAKKAFADKALALPHSLDAKFTTTALSKDLAAWATYGPPTGKTWNPEQWQRDTHPDIQPLKSHPWTVLTINPPPPVRSSSSPPK